jgi:type IV pilus assembly protein PilO
MAIDFSELKNFDVNSLDVNNLGSAPAAVRVIIIAIVIIGILVAGYYFDTKDQILVLNTQERKEVDLKKKFESKQQMAANLEAYKAQLEEMQYAFGAMLKQLPSKTEIPSLLIDISETGLSSGLKIDLFEPKDEQKKGFYAEKPIKLDVNGAYEELAQFASGVAALPRIVTLHEIAIKPSKDGGKLNMTAVAKTYRYLEDN